MPLALASRTSGLDLGFGFFLGLDDRWLWPWPCRRKCWPRYYLFVVRAESQNEDYDSEELGAQAAIRKTIIGVPNETRNVRVSKSKPYTAGRGGQPRSVTFRKTNEDMKKVVITNSMLSRPPETEAADKMHKYGVRVLNERALGRVRMQSLRRSA